MSVEDYASAGRDVPTPVVGCPRCRTRLRPDGGYPRLVRYRGQRHHLWVCRGRCTRCRSSHALFPDFVVAHHLDTADTIAAAVHGRGDPTLPASTVAGWRRRWHTNSSDLIDGTSAAFVAVTGTAPTGPGAESVAVLTAALWLAVRDRGGRASTPWRLLNAMSGTSWMARRVKSSWAGASHLPVPARGP